MGIRVVQGSREARHMMYVIAASPGFLEALGARLISGRRLEPRDTTAESPVVVISRSVAAGLFEGRDAVGQQMPSRGLGRSTLPPRIVGVVEDVRYDGLAGAPSGAVYMPWQQLPLGVVSLVVRTSGDPLGAVPAIQAQVQALDANLAIEAVRTLDGLAGASISERRLQTAAGGAFAVLTLVIAVLGLVASLMRSVSERRHELAVRAAVGATPHQLRLSVLLNAAALSLLGLLAGMGIALVATRVLVRALFGLSPLDPVTFAVTATGVLTISVSACLLPAIRAGHADPAQVLRSQ